MKKTIKFTCQRLLNDLYILIHLFSVILCHRYHYYPKFKDGNNLWTQGGKERVG